MQIAWPFLSIHCCSLYVKFGSAWAVAQVSNAATTPMNVAAVRVVAFIGLVMIPLIRAIYA
jgi:hypothetical protein